MQEQEEPPVKRIKAVSDETALMEDVEDVARETESHVSPPPPVPS